MSAWNKGHPLRVCRSISQVCDARIMEHKKPEEIQEIIVELYGNLPRIEILRWRDVKTG